MTMELTQEELGLLLSAIESMCVDGFDEYAELLEKLSSYPTANPQSAPD